jgi:hypothetical protein
MAIKLTISNKVKFKVEGTIKDADGVDQPFNFALTCKRLDAEELQRRFAASQDSTLGEFLEEITLDWAEVKDDAGQALAYSADSLKSLLRSPGLAALVYGKYITEIGAKAKN